MRRSKFSSPFLNISFITVTLSLGSVAAMGGCTDSMDVVDDGTDKHPDLAPPPPSDLAIPSADMSTPDMSTRGDMGRSDMGMTGTDLGLRDMAMSGGDLGPRDLAMSGDMTAPPDLPVADGGRTYTCRGADAPGTAYQLVTDSLTLPKGTGTTYVYDFDGSGKPKNALKSLMQLINTFGFDLQTPINDAVKNGSILQVASLTTDNFLTTSCAGVTIVPAKTTLTPPKFDGTDVLERYPLPAADLIGGIAAGQVQTKASKDLLPAEDTVLPLQLRIGPMSLVLPLHGVHAEGTISHTGTLNRISGGMLNGVVSAADVDAQVIPGSRPPSPP